MERAAFGDMEDALRSAAVGPRVVEHSLGDAVALEVRRREALAAGREREFAGEPGYVDGKGAAGQSRDAVRTHAGETRIQISLNARVHRREAVRE
jgi:hypothetical protein